MDDMNDWGSHELRDLDATNNSRLWILWKILHHELKPLNAMNGLGLWITWKTLGCELKILEAMNNLELWIIWMTQDPVNSGLYMLWTA